MLLAVSGVVVYRSVDCSVALTCPFPDSERMPKWTSMTVLCCSAKANNSQDIKANEQPPFEEEEDLETNLDLQGGDGDEEPLVRFITAGDNAKLYLWESPSAFEMVSSGRTVCDRVMGALYSLNTFLTLFHSFDPSGFV